MTVCRRAVIRKILFLEAPELNIACHKRTYYAVQSRVVFQATVFATNRGGETKLTNDFCHRLT